MGKPDIYDLIHKFNLEVVKIEPRGLDLLSGSEHQWLRQALHEEVDELAVAVDNPKEPSVVDAVDALGDLVIFAIGGLFRMGLTPNEARKCLEAIMEANFQKKAGVKEGRSGAPDAIKPEGFIPPEDRIREILGLG